MPAINVARTDTFEQQRVKINEISNVLFSVTSGGSDLATGLLKLGDGTRIGPSLSFTSDNFLGLYKPSEKTIGFVSDQKKIFDISIDANYSYKDFIVRQSILTTSGISISNAGQNYDVGAYTDIAITGGTGSGAIADVEVVAYGGTILNTGQNLLSGTYSNIALVGGNGTGAAANFTVDAILGNINNPGSAYSPGTFSDVPLTTVSGSGSGARADIVISGGSTIDGNITNGGSNYNDGSYFGIVLINGNGSGAEAAITVSSGVITAVSISSSGSGYQVNDILSVDPLFDGFGLGSGFQYTLSSVVNTGVVSDVIITNNGQDYAASDILSVNDANVGNGGGSGFEFLITSDPGIVKDFSFTDRGTGYQTNDVLSLPGATTGITTTLKGQVFGLTTTLSTLTAQITVSSTDGIVAGMDVFGGGENDVGQLAGSTTVLSVDSSTLLTLSANPTVDGAATLSFTSPGNLNEFVVSSTTGINPGDLITQTAGSGDLGTGITVSDVNTTTNTITMSGNPVKAGSATLTFSPLFGVPTVNFQYQVGNLGVVDVVSITQGGNGYSLNDQLSVTSTDLTQPITWTVTNKSLEKISFNPKPSDTTFSVGDTIKLRDGEVLSIQTTSTPATTPSTVGPLSTTLNSASTQITVSNTAGISQGDLVSQGGSDTGVLAENTTVASVDNATTITLSAFPSLSGAATLTFSSNESGTFTGVASTTNGSGSGATFDVTRDPQGNVTSVNINTGGFYYADGDVITIAGSLVGGSTPANNITLDVLGTSINQDVEIYKIITSNGNTDFIYVDYSTQLAQGDAFVRTGTSSPEYIVDTFSDLIYRFFVDTGSGAAFTPDLTMYVGSSYEFDLSDSSNSGHQFSLSRFPDGIHPPSYISGVTATLNTSSQNITVSSSTGIVVGMTVSVISGSGLLGQDTLVEAIVGNTITLSSSPLADGFVSLLFRGVEYTDGVVRSGPSLLVSVNDTTPNLYYYCGLDTSAHYDEGGEDSDEALITIDPNNPKVFGSGLIINADLVQETDVVSSEVETGLLTSLSLSTGSIQADTMTIVNSANIPSLTNSSLTTTNISSGSTITLSANSGVKILSTTTFGSNLLTIDHTSGDLTSSGILKTTTSININDKLFITDNIISSSANTDIELNASTGRVTKFGGVSAITIPSGNTLERPPQGIAQNGSIRFNTQTNQYEGYSANTTSWSSLGGVRDLDGNTYIKAEESVGSNDNRLWFYNDNSNTLRVTTQYLEFMSMKKIRSLNLSAPTYTVWTSSTPVIAGQYLKYSHDIYEVITGGTTGGTGNEPSDTTGNTFTNGTAVLQYYSTAVAPLTFEELTEIRIGPNRSVPVIFQGDLRITKNTIATDITDLTLKPNTGRRIICFANTHLQIPSGTNDERSTGTAKNGSIRYNTTNQVYEGFSETTGTWGSLGGVKDVDQNTYIIPETSPGANENILYFYNNNINTINLSTTTLDFANIDTITSTGSNSLEITASSITLDNSSTTIDNTGSSTFISTTKDNLDLGVSSGLTNDVVLRLDDQGDVYFNTGFGTGSQSLVRVFDSELSSLEISNYRITTSKSTLTKGTTNNGSSVIYSPATELSGKVEFIVHNVTTGDKEIIEFSVIDKGSDIFYTEIGTIQSGGSLITYTFDFNVNNAVRLNYSLANGVANANVVNVTVVSNVIKK